MCENQYKKIFLQELLRFLLMKYERSKAFQTGVPSTQRPQFHLERNNPFVKDFKDEMDYRKREWIIEVVTDLEGQGIISVSKDKFNPNLINKIYLEIDKVENAYKISSVTPLTEKLSRMRRIIEPLLDHKWEWIMKWAKIIIQNFDEKKSGGLNVDNHIVYEDVVKVLLFLPGIEGNVPMRNLSNRLFNDSKHLEKKVMNTLISVLKKSSEIEFENDDEMLAFFGIVKIGKQVRVCGNVAWLNVEGAHVSTSLFIGGLGLSDATVESIEEVKLGEDRVVFIENLTSYEQWIHQRRDEKEVVIYTGGYPHKTLQSFLTKLSDQLDATTPIYHWGDIDIGGIRIFNYMKHSFFDRLQPLFMDMETLKRLKEYSIPITSQNREMIKKMIVDDKYSDWRPVLQELLDAGFKLEQESVFDVTRVRFDKLVEGRIQ